MDGVRARWVAGIPSAALAYMSAELCDMRSHGGSVNRRYLGEACPKTRSRIERWTLDVER